MAIVVTLSPKIEALLRERAIERGQDINSVASELLTNLLEWEDRDREDAVRGIQQGLDDFEAGRFRSFQDFARELSF